MAMHTHHPILAIISLPTEETNNSQITPRPTGASRILRITIHHSYILIHLYIQNVHAHRLPLDDRLAHHPLSWRPTPPTAPTNTIHPKQPAHFEAIHSALLELTQLTS